MHESIDTTCDDTARNATSSTYHQQCSLALNGGNPAVQSFGKIDPIDGKMPLYPGSQLKVTKIGQHQPRTRSGAGRERAVWLGPFGRYMLYSRNEYTRASNFLSFRSTWVIYWFAWRKQADESSVAMPYRVVGALGSFLFC